MQREIEAAGICTITLSPIHELTASVGAPRVAAIEYPPGLSFGRPGDAEGQMAVLRSTLRALVEMRTPGSVAHLPFEWPEPPKEVDTHPPESPPIVKHLIGHPWLIPRFVRRDIPAAKAA